MNETDIQSIKRTSKNNGWFLDGLPYRRLPSSGSPLSFQGMVWPFGFATALPWQGVLQESKYIIKYNYIISIAVRPITRLRSSQPKFWFQTVFHHLHEMLLRVIDMKAITTCSATVDSHSKLEAWDSVTLLPSHLRRHCISLYNHYVYTLNYTFGEKALREQRSQIAWESPFPPKPSLTKWPCDYVHVIVIACKCNI